MLTFLGESVNISAINREKKQCKGALNLIINASFCVSGNFIPVTGNYFGR